MCFGSPSVKYAPLPWVHIADALRPSIRRLRIVLEEPAFGGERTFVRLHDGPRTESIVETRPLLTGQTPLSARERAAVEILHEAGPSHAKKGRFSLTKAQIGRLLAFAQDVPLEVEGKGAVAVIPKPARITGRVKDVVLPSGDGGTALVFEATDAEGARIKDPQILGEREAFLLDDQLKLYRVAPPLLPGEANALLLCEPLMLQGLTTDEGKGGFEAVVGLGVELANLVEVARASDPAPKTVLRAMLTRADDGPGFALRVHLVTELHVPSNVGQLDDEVEVSARGALPPCTPSRCPRPRSRSPQRPSPPRVQREAPGAALRPRRRRAAARSSWRVRRRTKRSPAAPSSISVCTRPLRTAASLPWVRPRSTCS